MKILSEDEFDAQYTVVTDADGDTVRPDHAGIDADSKHLWTVVEGDDDSLYALNGVHLVNRIGYLVTEEPWGEDIEAVWHEGQPDQDDDDDDEAAAGTGS